MDIAVDKSAPGTQKRSREGCSCVEFDGSNKSPNEKKLCQSLGENVNISTLLEDASEVNDIFNQSTLDEAQEKLLSGVMRSLEEELEASYVSSPHHGEAVDLYSFPACRMETCLYEEYSLHNSDVTSTSSEGELQSFELPPLENVSVPNEKISTTAETSSLGLQSITATEVYVEGGCECSDKSPKLVDLDYLLEASDNELGIAPSPSSESGSPEAELFSVELHETDFRGADNGIDNQEPWPQNWDCNPEILFELGNDELSNQDWFRRVLPSFEMFADPTIREYPSFEIATPY